MKDQGRRRLLNALAALLRPLVRILLKQGVPFGSFAEVARHVYVDVAFKEFSIPNRKQTVSRVSVISGLTRKDVVRLLEEGLTQSEDTMGDFHRAARVVSRWASEHIREDGTPEDLPLDGAEKSFASLVKRYSGDMPIRAVLDELVRVGTVAILEGGRLRLVTPAYLPGVGDEKIIDIMGEDVAELIGTIDHNLASDPAKRRFQRKVLFDNLPDEALPEIRKALGKRGQALLVQMNNVMSQYDRDRNPGQNGTGRNRAAIGIYYYEEVWQDDKDATNRSAEPATVLAASSGDL